MGAGAPPLVWVTRAEPGASATARRLADLGYEPVVSPLLRVEPVAADINLTGVSVLAFTSANGVRAFAERSPERSPPVYVVGDATAEAARAAGFARVASADGDVGALATMLMRNRGQGVVLHPGAEDLAGDLAGTLANFGVQVRRLILYRTVEVEPLEALTRWERLDAVLLHSPRAARALERLMAARPAPRLRAVAISAATAEPLEHLHLAGVATAPLPKESALLGLLAELVRL